MAGCDALSDPLCNKGTAFTRDERTGLGIEGLLPPRVESLEEQAARVAANLQAGRIFPVASRMREVAAAVAAAVAQLDVAAIERLMYQPRYL